MAMTLEQVRQVIITRMLSFTGIDQARIQYPNAPSFKVPKDGLWCRLTIAGGSSFISGITDLPCTRRTGSIMIQCFARPHTGEKDITVLSDALLGHFEYFFKDHLQCLQGQSIYAGKVSDFIQYNISIFYSVN
ncbi:hypothetical protein [Acinetobacter sp. NIPH 2100]|uniref:hypothetical protein n=1 Tax=Acinetobacter sp. NIPH 2100 TaxID=1217708 RepID=UPI0002D0F95A|nr:hypothetical protein [Acinetobacter sp. NIPH 2100]ENX41539.1 hypothetical protein F887_01935 [Acinetobacter sp. NIPH 2100]